MASGVLIAAKPQLMRTRKAETAAKAAQRRVRHLPAARTYDGDGSLTRALATAPVDVGPWCTAALTETSVEQAARCDGPGASTPRSPPRPSRRKTSEVVGSLAADGIPRRHEA